MSAAFWQCPRCRTPNPWASYLTACVSCGEARPPHEAREAFAPRPEPPAPRNGEWAASASWAYLGICLAALALVKLLGDRWWPATVLMFGPRWLFLFPIPPLAIWAALRRRRKLWMLHAAALAVVGGPLMGLRLPLHTLFAAKPEGERVRVLSLNHAGGLLDVDALTQMVVDGRYDVVCFQETGHHKPLDEFFASEGWHRSAHHAIYSRFPIVGRTRSLPWEGRGPGGAGPARFHLVRVRLPSGREVVIANAHMPTMRFGFAGLRRGDAHAIDSGTSWRSEQMDEVIAELRGAGDAPVILAGDFNMPPDSPLMGRLRRHVTSGFEGVGWGYGYTRPSRFCWIGIDRILASPGCHFVSSSVMPRVGSDHRPIDAEVVVPPR